MFAANVGPTTKPPSSGADLHGMRYSHKSAAVSGRDWSAGARAFTLIEILIVVVILGILASVVVPRLANAGDQTAETALRRHIQIVRHQIEYYRNRELAEPDLLGNQWDDLVLAGTEYLTHPPVNPLSKLTLIVADAANGPAGWVWRDDGNGTFDIYATDETGTAELVE